MVASRNHSIPFHLRTFLQTKGNVGLNSHKVCLFLLPAILGGTLQENIRQLEEEIEMLSVGLDLGDLVQIRGKLKCYRGMREVMAKYISECVM